MFKIYVNSEEPEKTLAKLAKRIERPKAFLTRWGNAVAIKAQANARAKGGKNFWREIAQATRLRKVTNESALVSSDHVAAAQKEFGGVIKPKNKKALTIPISEEAIGKTVGDFKKGGRELFMIHSDAPDTLGFLGYDDGDMFHALFILRKKVTQKPDPWWPTESEINDMGVREGKFWMDEELKRVAT